MTAEQAKVAGRKRPVAPPKDSVSRARGRKTGQTDTVTEQRLAIISTMMRALTFRRGKTAKELAQKWDLSLARVHELTAEASKRVRAEVLDPDHVGATVGNALETVIERALKAGDRRTVVEAARVWAQISGANAPQRHEHTGAGGGSIHVDQTVTDVSKMSDDDLLSRMKALRSKK